MYLRALANFNRRGFVICRNVVPLKLLSPFQNPEWTLPVLPLDPLLGKFLSEFGINKWLTKPGEQESSGSITGKMLIFKANTWASSGMGHGSCFWHRESEYNPVITIPLARWTWENGATELMEKSHLTQDSHDVCRRKQMLRYATMNVGDMLITHPRILHRRGIAATDPTSGRDGIFILLDRLDKVVGE